jgi:CheY-like chemotaxis protein
LVEDGIVNQKVAGNLLRKRGHEVSIANNGVEAVELNEENDFDVILMDIQMPVMDGFEATATIRGKEKAGGRRTPIVAITAHAMIGDRARCLEAGMDDYISKPFRPRELFEAVEAAEPAAAGDVPGDSREGVKREPDRPPFDLAVAREQTGDSDEILLETIELFLTESLKLMKEILQAREEADPVRLGRAAHTLKGEARLLAASETAEAAYQLERMGDEDNFSEWDESWVILQNELSRLKAALRDFLESDRKPGDVV